MAYGWHRLREPVPRGSIRSVVATGQLQYRTVQTKYSVEIDEPYAD